MDISLVFRLETKGETGVFCPNDRRLQHRSKDTLAEALMCHTMR